jgi:hypothetical protein
MAREAGVESLVRIMPCRPRAEALAIIKGCDAAIVCGQSGSDAMASVPAKIFEYIGLRKDIFAIGLGAEACRIIRRAGCRLWLAEPSPAHVARTLQEFLAADAPVSEATPPAEFTQNHMAARLEQVLLSVQHDTLPNETASVTPAAEVSNAQT